jgi:hypothetical protein
MKGKCSLTGSFVNVTNLTTHPSDVAHRLQLVTDISCDVHGGIEVRWYGSFAKVFKQAATHDIVESSLKEPHRSKTRYFNTIQFWEGKLTAILVTQ